MAITNNVLNIYFQMTYHIPEPLLGVTDTLVKKTDQNPCPVYILWEGGEEDN